jgi:hypothetical protein
MGGGVIDAVVGIVTAIVAVEVMSMVFVMLQRQVSTLQ